MEPKERILKGAEELFFKYELRVLQWMILLNILPFPKKTIYQFYADKNEIVETLMQATLQQDECEFQEIQAASENMIEEVMHMMKHISVMFAKTNPNIFLRFTKVPSKSMEPFQGIQK
jgi:hypothetical protein